MIKNSNTDINMNYYIDYGSLSEVLIEKDNAENNEKRQC